VHRGIIWNRQGTSSGSAMIPRIACDCRLWRRLFGSRQGRVRHQQFRRIADKPGGSPPAGYFQDAFFIRFNNVRVAHPDNRIISHLPSQRFRTPDRIRDGVMMVPPTKHTQLRLVYRALTGKTRESNFGIVTRRTCQSPPTNAQNRKVIPTWLG
jgi:hypothetical protein